MKIADQNNFISSRMGAECLINDDDLIESRVHAADENKSGVNVRHLIELN